MIKRIISLVIFLLLVNAGAARRHRLLPRSAVQGRRAASWRCSPADKSEEVVRAQVMELAQQNQIPLDPGLLEITRKAFPAWGTTRPSRSTYAVLVNVAPGYTRRFDFDYATP